MRKVSKLLLCQIIGKVTVGLHRRCEMHQREAALGLKEIYTRKIPDADSDFRDCTREVTVEVTEDGSKVRLAKTVLLADETGCASHLSGEELTRFVWARKEFLLEDTRLRWAKLVFYVYEYHGNTLPLYVDVNGHTLLVPPGQKDLCGYHCWRTLDVPPHFLRQGLNEFIFRSDSAAFNSWTLGLEGGNVTGRSAKSIDGGRTWRREWMGFHEALRGEYLVRLQLGRYASQGTITSPVIDLAEAATGIAELCTIEGLRLVAKAKTPEGTDVTLHYRTGKVPSEAEEWGPWLEVSSKSQGNSVVQRFIQWQATLSTSHPLLTPELEEVVIEVQRSSVAGKTGRVFVQQRDDVDLTQSSFPFSYQSINEPKLSILRQQEKLDEVIKGATCEFEQFLALREWVSQQWPYHPGYPYPPWDALVILDWLRRTRPGAHGGCMHYAVVFCQCCLSLGLQARLVLLASPAFASGDGHFVTEVWSNDYRKWVFMDPTANSHFEAGGAPLSMLEVRDLWESGRVDEIKQVSGPAHPHVVLGSNYPLEHLRRGGFRYAGLVLRNDHLTSLSPYEPEHGMATYKWTGFLWWGRDIPQELPQFPLYSDRLKDFYWPVNQVSINLQRMEESHLLMVMLSSIAPNFETFEVSIDDDDWKPSASSFLWNLKAGTNRLRARVKNKFGVVGRPSSVDMVFQPD